MTEHLTWADRVAELHSRQNADDTQYGIVWRFANATDVQQVLGPPAGDRWELNTDYGDDGMTVNTPSWSGGGIVQQLTHWRRVSRGMTNADPKRVVQERVRWEGDPRP